MFVSGLRREGIIGGGNTALGFKGNRDESFLTSSMILFVCSVNFGSCKVAFFFEELGVLPLEEKFLPIISLKVNSCSPGFNPPLLT